MTFREHLPHTKFIFPTAPLRRAVAFNRSLTHQWFDIWSLTQPEIKEHLQIQGLRETAEYLQGLLREEIEDIGPQNVVLMGLSQGCAASIVTAMLWQGKPFGAVVGMCGYLPFSKQMHIHIEGSKNEETDDHVIFGEDDGGDVLERPSEECEEGTKLETAINWLHEELQFIKDGRQDASPPPVRYVPVFMGHGIADDKVPIEKGRLAAELLRYMDVAVTWKEYDNLGHWYHGAMLRDVVKFLQALKGWENTAGSVNT